jgi:hypothetical protein
VDILLIAPRFGIAIQNGMVSRSASSACTATTAPVVLVVPRGIAWYWAWYNTTERYLIPRVVFGVVWRGICCCPDCTQSIVFRLGGGWLEALSPCIDCKTPLGQDKITLLNGWYAQTAEYHCVVFLLLLRSRLRSRLGCWPWWREGSPATTYHQPRLEGVHYVCCYCYKQP